MGNTYQIVNGSRDFHNTIGEGLAVTATGVSVVFAVLVIMIIFINLFKTFEPKIEELLENLFKSKKAPALALDSTPASKTSQEAQNIDNTTLVLISAAVATYTHQKAKIRRIRVLPDKPKKGGNWAMQMRNVIQSHNSKKNTY